MNYNVQSTLRRSEESLMENSPSSSSSGSPDPDQPPVYFRLSSVVTEKPDTESERVYEDDFRMLTANLADNRPVVLPSSPASSDSKSDNEALSSEAEQDEGFDEEFEDRDAINENEPKYFELGDLDPKQLQQLLEDPQLPNLEDFDLGVDVLDSESMRAPGPYSNSPYHPPTSPYHPPTSPYQAMVTTSPAPAMELNINQLYNDYNLSESFFGEDPPSVQSNVSALTSTSRGTDELPLTMPMFVPDSSISYQHQSSPVLTAAATGMDLAETSNLLSTDTLIELSTALTTEDAVDTQSMYTFGNGTGHLGLLPLSSSQQNGTGVGGASPQVLTLLDSTMLPMCSQASLTGYNRNANVTPSPPPPPSATRHSHHRRPLSPSPSPSPNPGMEMSREDKKLVEMPYYQFRKLLDDPTVPERRKEEIKNVRRRGRNKTAAKACRNKKMQMIMGLEQEVEQLRKTKSLISGRTHSLEREITELKKRCLTRVGTIS